MNSIRIFIINILLLFEEYIFTLFSQTALFYIKIEDNYLKKYEKDDKFELSNLKNLSELRIKMKVYRN